MCVCVLLFGRGGEGGHIRARAERLFATHVKSFSESEDCVSN